MVGEKITAHCDKLSIDAPNFATRPKGQGNGYSVFTSIRSVHFNFIVRSYTWCCYLCIHLCRNLLQNQLRKTLEKLGPNNGIQSKGR